MRPLRRRLFRGLSLCTLAVGIGCTTIKTKYYDYDETGERGVKCLKGLPVTLKVPTHLRLEVTETHYFTTDGKLIPTGKPARGLDYQFIDVKELYTVDFKRPAAGILDLKVGLEGQYFKKIQTDVTDESLAKIADLVQAAIAVLPSAAAKAISENNNTDKPGTGPVAIPRALAVEVFDLRTPGIEARVQAFLDRYINNCTDPCPAAGCPVPVSVLPTGR